MTETRVYGLSFLGDAGHLGETFVEVTARHAAEAFAYCPCAIDDDTAWIAAALAVATRAGANPGGEVELLRLDDMFNPAQLATIPKNRLLSRDESEALGPAIEALKDAP